MRKFYEKCEINLKIQSTYHQFFEYFKIYAIIIPILLKGGEFMINNIIFDWNGTLMDDTLFTMNIENEMLAKRGMNTLTL